MDAVYIARAKVSATALSNELFEVVRNLSYEDVGLVAGVPAGIIPSSQTYVRDGIEFSVKTTIRNIDDPFDGTVGGEPNDLSPADYKLVELSISCPKCNNFQPISVTSHVGPRSLESASNNGSLFVRVIDALGAPISNATVSITNELSNPQINISDVTNKDGFLQVVDTPPGVESYEIRASRDGYTSDMTYDRTVQNPNPTKPHATVLTQKLTQLSVAIDRQSVLEVGSIDALCAPVSSSGFSMKGTKLAGTNPDVYKYFVDHVTDIFGLKTISGLEWDVYAINSNDVSRSLVGTFPNFPIKVDPGTNQPVKLILGDKRPNQALINVFDTNTGLPISSAEVRLVKSGYDKTIDTGTNVVYQTDWSGGDGQNDYVVRNKFFESINIDASSTPGLVKLANQGMEYKSNGYLTSSTYDMNSSANFYAIEFSPHNQPLETGQNSVRLQIATNNDNATWNFVGPDGTSGSYYDLLNQDINVMHNGHRYLRYRLFFNTEDTSFTPAVSEVMLRFSNDCTPGGQVVFSDLSVGQYDITVTKSGYAPFSDTVDISIPWRQINVSMTQ